MKIALQRHLHTEEIIRFKSTFKNKVDLPFVESFALPLVVHQKVMEGGWRLDAGAASVIAHIATVATAWACGGEAEGGLGSGRPCPWLRSTLASVTRLRESREEELHSTSGTTTLQVHARSRWSFG